MQSGKGESRRQDVRNGEREEVEREREMEKGENEKA